MERTRKGKYKTIREIEFLNICDCLEPFKEEICRWYLKKGQEYTIKYIFTQFDIVIYSNELENFVDDEQCQLKIMNDEFGKYKNNVYAFYKTKGLRRLKNYVFNQFGFKLKKSQLRMFLGLKINKHYLYVQEIRRLSWNICGFNGSYSPIAADKYMNTHPGRMTGILDEKINEEGQRMVNHNKIILLSAGLLQQGRKLGHV